MFNSFMALPNLGHPLTGMGGLVRIAEHRVFVRVERNGAAMRVQIRLQSAEATERTLGFGEFQMHQRACRIINEDEQGAGRTALFEPVMVRPVDLDQLAIAFPARAQLLERAALLARKPDPGILHPFA